MDERKRIIYLIDTKNLIQTHIITECHIYERERTNLKLTETLDEILGPQSRIKTKKFSNF